MYSRIYKQYDIFVKLINEILMKFSIIEVVVDISSCIHTAPYESMEDIKNKLNHIHIRKYTRGGVWLNTASIFCTYVMNTQILVTSTIPSLQIPSIF